MLPLALSALDVLVVVSLGAAGFVVVTLVCAAVLAMLHLVLPAVDSGAAELDERAPSVEDDLARDRSALDTGGDA